MAAPAGGAWKRFKCEPRVEDFKAACSLSSSPPLGEHPVSYAEGGGKIRQKDIKIHKNRVYVKKN